MMGAFCAWFLLNLLGIGYWPSLIVVPIVVGIVGIAIERLLLRRIARLDHLYGLLLTFGLALIIEGVFRQQYGSSGSALHDPQRAGGRPQPRLHVPADLSRLGHRLFARRVSGHLVRHRAHAAGRLPARRDREPDLVQAFGINVPRMVTLTYGAGVGLARSPGCWRRRSIR